jgi:PPOX class probable F420-dependent enzyme
MIDLTSEFGRAVKRHLENEHMIWLVTVDSKGMPQPRPVWFLWQDDSFLVFSQPKAYKLKHIEEHPQVALHFNSSEDGEKHVIVFLGEATIEPNSPPAPQVPAYLKKYKDGIAGIHMTPEQFGHDYSVAIKIKPAEVRGWE